MRERRAHGTRERDASSPTQMARAHRVGPLRFRREFERVSKTPAHQAFTLIELLVVISIIVMLMALLLPTLQRVRKQVKAVVCQANLRQWGIAYSAYIADHEGRMVDEAIDAKERWFVHLQAHLTDCNEIPTCPAAPRQPAITGSEGQIRGSTAYWSTTGGYGHNRYIQGKTYDRLVAPSYIPALFDCGLHSVWPRPDDCPPEYEGDSWMTRGLLETMKMVCINRHGGRINMLFLDWSVRPVGLKELWTLKWHSDFDTAGPWTRAGGVLPEDWPAWMRKFKDY